MTGRLAAAWARVESGVTRALAQDNTPGEIAASFAVASAYAVLPTAGTALVVFLVAAALSRRVSRVALAAALVVFNPAVKWAVYAASYPLGAALLGPAPGVENVSVVAPDELFTAFSVGAVRGVVARQLLGNALLAVASTVVGYVVVFQLARWYDSRGESVRGEEPVSGDDATTDDPEPTSTDAVTTDRSRTVTHTPESPMDDPRPTTAEGGERDDPESGTEASDERGTDTGGGGERGSDPAGSGADTTSTQ